VRTIPLSDKQAARVHIVRTAPSYPATIEFPEPFLAQPACGDCGERGLFKLDAFADARYLTIKPRLFAGPQSDGTTIAIQDFLTVLTVRLQSYTLTIQVEYTDDPSRADPRVVFTLPDRGNETAYVKAELAKERQRLEQDMASRIDKGVTSALLTLLSEPHSCSTLSARARKDDLVVEANELCVFGRRYFVRFSIENRGRTPVDIGELRLRAGASRTALAEAQDLDRHLASERLDVHRSTVALIGFRLDEGLPLPRLFELAVHERGGLSRTVVLPIEP
jgi:hypothetical protein